MAYWFNIKTGKVEAHDDPERAKELLQEAGYRTN